MNVYAKYRPFIRKWAAYFQSRRTRDTGLRDLSRRFLSKLRNNGGYSAKVSKETESLPGYHIPVRTNPCVHDCKEAENRKENGGIFETKTHLRNRYDLKRSYL